MCIYVGTDWYTFTVQCLHEIYQEHPKQTVPIFPHKTYQANIKYISEITYVYIKSNSSGLLKTCGFSLPVIKINWKLSPQCMLSDFHSSSLCSPVAWCAGIYMNLQWCHGSLCLNHVRARRGRGKGAGSTSLECRTLAARAVGLMWKDRIRAEDSSWRQPGHHELQRWGKPV